MLNKRTIKIFLSTVMLFTFLLTACGGQSAPAPETDAAAPESNVTTQADFDKACVGHAGEVVTVNELKYLCPTTQTGNEQQSGGQSSQSGGAPASQPTNAPAVSNADTSAYEGTAACEDGENTTPLFFEKPTDVPWGTKEGAVIAQIAWKPGNGFAGWWRIIAIAERILGIEMPYANNILTLYVTQYCGGLVDIKNEAHNHVTAMVNSSQDSIGDRPSPDEIPIVLLKRDGSIEWVKQAPNGPSMDEIRAHLELRP